MNECGLPEGECNIKYCPFDPYECETGREVFRQAAEFKTDQNKNEEPNNDGSIPTTT